MSGKEIREALGFMGVIASLVFVGLEIRQNTKATRAAAIQASTGVARQQVQMFALDPEANRLNMIGADNPEELSQEEFSRYRWIVVSFFWGMQGLHSQWELGVLPDAEWKAWNEVICRNVARPGVRLVWKDLDFYTPSFTAVVESCPGF